jgi:hypothetical protein
MSSKGTRTSPQTRIHAIVGGVADQFGRGLNSAMILLGDKFGLYKTGQYRTDRAEPGVPATAPSSLPPGARPSIPGPTRLRRRARRR